ncbi:MAG: hypothetical protein ACO4BW_04355 [Nitriliruptoraceae bacterium]|jgi:hypothetical protein
MDGTHRSRLTAPDLRVVRPGDPGASGAVLVREVAGDPEALGRLLAAVEPLRATGAVVATDADAEVGRFLAVLAVLDGRAELPAYDLDDPALKWHAPAGVRAVANRPEGAAGATPADPGGAS